MIFSLPIKIMVNRHKVNGYKLNIHKHSSDDVVYIRKYSKSLSFKPKCLAKYNIPGMYCLHKYDTRLRKLYLTKNKKLV